MPGAGLALDVKSASSHLTYGRARLRLPIILAFLDHIDLAEQQGRYEGRLDEGLDCGRRRPSLAYRVTSRRRRSTGASDWMLTHPALDRGASPDAPRGKLDHGLGEVLVGGDNLNNSLAGHSEHARDFRHTDKMGRHGESVP
jgi:hypothetical protein